MKQGAVLCLIAVTMFAAGAAASVAHAQDSVMVTVTTHNTTVSAGATVSDAGDCTITNNSTENVTLNTVTYTVSTPGLFASTTLTVAGTPQTMTPPSSSNNFTFSVGVTIAPTKAVNCSMSAMISSNPSATGRLERLRPAFASATGASNRAPGILLLAGLVMLLAAGKLRRRHLAVLALAMILAATEAACGNTNNSSIVGTSTQTISAISATSSKGVTPTGLPATMGTITVQ